MKMPRTHCDHRLRPKCLIVKALARAWRRAASRLNFSLPHPYPAVHTMEQLMAASDVLADRIGHAVEIAHSRFELRIERLLLVVLENRRSLELRVRRADAGNFVLSVLHRR